MKVIIAGSRYFNDYNFLEQEVDKILPQYEVSEIVSGRANGVDRLGERYAREHRIDCAYFPAKWDEHGKAAGPIRNRAMAEYADILIAFWDGESKGTAHMIRTARDHDLDVYVVRTDNDESIN